MKVLKSILAASIAALLVSCAGKETKPITIDTPVPADMKVLETEQRDGYRVELIEYNVAADERVKAFLLTPDGIDKGHKAPGLVLLHDHGARFDIGKEKLVRPLASAPDYIKASAQQWIDSGFDGIYFGDRLAREGYVVIAPDMLYWGSRSTEMCQKLSRIDYGGEEGDRNEYKTPVYEGQRAVYDSLLAKDGSIWAEKTIHEDAAAAWLIKNLDYVDGDKIGAFGWSMGAHRTWLLTAFCDWVKTGVALCWMTLKQTCANPPKASDYSMLIPSLRDNYDFPDIAQWLAPKPFYFLNGDKDKLFPVPETQEAFDRMNATYEAAGAADKLRTEFFDGEHHCGPAEQDKIIAFFDQQFK